MENKSKLYDTRGNQVYSWDDSLILYNCYTNKLSCAIYGMCKTYSFVQVLKYKERIKQKKYKKYKNRRCMTMNSKGLLYEPEIKRTCFNLFW